METLPNFQKGVQTPSITHQITFDSPFPLLSSIDDHLDLSYFFPSYVLSVHMYVVAMQPTHAAVKTARWLRKCHFIFRYMPSPLQAFFTKANKSCWSDFLKLTFSKYLVTWVVVNYFLCDRGLSLSFFKETNFEKKNEWVELLNIWNSCLSPSSVKISLPYYTDNSR